MGGREGQQHRRKVVFEFSEGRHRNRAREDRLIKVGSVVEFSEMPVCNSLLNSLLPYQKFSYFASARKKVTDE